jgi:hypothetical protein
MVNVVDGIFHRPVFLCWFLVRSIGEQDGSSRSELLSCLEDYTNGYYFFYVNPVTKIEKNYSTSHFNKRGVINKSLLLALDFKFRASNKHPEFKVDIM